MTDEGHKHSEDQNGVTKTKRDILSLFQQGKATPNADGGPSTNVTLLAIWRWGPLPTKAKHQFAAL